MNSPVFPVSHILVTSLLSVRTAHGMLFAVHKLSEFQFRLLGLVPLSFFVAQTVHYWRFGLGNLLWMCNIGNLLLAIGMFLNHRELIRAAAIWTIPGLGIWFWYVWLSGSTALSSTLAHVGGVIVGVLVLRRVRMDRIAWFYAFAWYLFIQFVSRVATARELNVNVAQFIQPGWKQAFSSFWKFWIVMTLVVAIGLWGIGKAFSLIWPQSKTELQPAGDVIASALPPAD